MSVKQISLLSGQLVNITTVLGPSPAGADARAALVRLQRAVARSPSATVVDVGAVQQLDVAGGCRISSTCSFVLQEQ